MTITFVNNLGLSEMATGDNSGTWGNVTNTNLELIGQALGHGTRVIANASADDLTMSDGTADDDRALYLKLTGGGQACTVTLKPPTMSKVWIMENGTAAALTFTQGSGANVVIPAGDTKVIACTGGAGTAQIVYDVFTDLNLAGTTVVDDLTVSDDLVVGGLATIGETLAVTGVLTTTAATVFNGGFAAGGVGSFADGSASAPSITNTGDVNTGIFFPAADQVGIATGGTVRHTTSSLGIVGTGAVNIRDFDGFLGNIDHTATNTSMVISSGTSSTNATNVFWSDVHASFSGQIHNVSVSSNSGTVAGAGLQAFWVYNGSAFVLNHYLGSIAGQETCFNEASVDMDFRIESNGNANMIFVDGGSDHVCIGTSTDFGGILNVKTTDNTANLALGCTDADANRGPVIDLRRDNSSAADGDQIGCIIFNADDDANNMTEYATITGFIQDASNTTEDGGIIFDTATGGNPAIEKLRLSATEAVFNNDSADVDFRVESNGNANMLFVDGGNNRVGVGIGIPYSTFTINEPTDGGNALHLSNATGSSNGGSTNVIRSTGNGNAYWSNLQIHANGLAFLPQGDSDTVLIADTNGIVFNEGGVNKDFRVESADNTHCLFVDASTDTVQIGGSVGTGITGLSDSRFCINGIASHNGMVIREIGENLSYYTGKPTNNTGTRFPLYIVNASGTNVGSISHTSSAMAFNTSSDYRMKENVDYSWDATTRLKQLKPARFNFIINPDETVDGFLAHEVSSIVPEAVQGTYNQVDADGDPVYQGIDQSKLVPLLVKTILELEARITALES